MSIFSKLFGSRKFDIPQEDLPDKASSQESPANKESSIVFDDPETQTVVFDNKDDLSEPADIPEGIRYIVTMQGKDYLTSRGFINILNDFHLLKDQKAIRSVLLNMQQDGLMEELVNTSSFLLVASSAKKKLVSDYAIKESIVSYVVDSLGYGLSFIDSKPTLAEERQTTTPSKEKVKQMEIELEPVSSGPINLGPYDPKLDLQYYHYPTLDLLTVYDNDGIPYIDTDEQEENKTNIVEVLNTLGFVVSSIKGIVGPTVTLYEITPAPGMRISRIRNNEQTIAIRLATQCRIIAPIPGKGAIGIELPNHSPSPVSMYSLINTKIFQESSCDLPCMIGRNVENANILHDLSTENLLIAGAMGQGLRDVLYAIIISLLYKKHPAEMKLVLIDPIGSSFNVYKSLDKHFLAAIWNYSEDPIISSANSAVETLKSLCIEMDARLNLLRLAAVRNIAEYNHRFVMRQLNPEKGHKYMPRIVLAIAEYTDYINVAGAEFEQTIIKLSQRGKLVGIHIVMATEQPHNKVLTPSIKMNFPSRIALRVPTHLDSATILDQPGAEKLLGNGDALYSKGLSLTRIQSPLNNDMEVDRICKFISSQQGYFDPYELPDTNPLPEPSHDVDMTHLDPMFEDAARLIVQQQSGSTSLIQRKFTIGYNRAGRLMDQLEKAGIVGRAYGSKPREVLVKDEYTLETIFRKLR